MATKVHFHAARATLVSVAVIATVVVVALVALHAAEAAGPQLSCGETVTSDTTLDRDLLDCPNNGIVIGAADITLDLDGHTVTGDGQEFKACPEDEFCDVGVLSVGHDDVTVRDGSVREFAEGVFIASTLHNRVLEVSSSRNAFFGFVVTDSAKASIRDSSGNHNPAPEGDGLGLFTSRGVRVVDNEFRHNAQPGIHVAFATDNLIKGNLISHSGPGLSIEKADGNRVRRNRFLRNGAGLIIAPGSRNVIARNHFSRDGDGIAVEKGRHNLIRRNEVVRARQDGVYLGLDAPEIGGIDNVVRRNTVRRSGDDGFDVRRRENHSVLKRNRAVGAGDDGFDIESRSTRLANNTATNNDDLGIAVRRDAFDGGGNRASGNGDRRQCVNVRCR